LPGARAAGYTLSPFGHSAARPGAPPNPDSAQPGASRLRRLWENAQLPAGRRRHELERTEDERATRVDPVVALRDE